MGYDEEIEKCRKDIERLEGKIDDLMAERKLPEADKPFIDENIRAIRDRIKVLDDRIFAAMLALIEGFLFFLLILLLSSGQLSCFQARKRSRLLNRQQLTSGKEGAFSAYPIPSSPSFFTETSFTGPFDSSSFSKVFLKNSSKLVS